MRVYRQGHTGRPPEGIRCGDPRRDLLDDPGTICPLLRDLNRRHGDRTGKAKYASVRARQWTQGPRRRLFLIRHRRPGRGGAFLPAPALLYVEIQTERRNPGQLPARRGKVEEIRARTGTAREIWPGMTCRRSAPGALTALPLSRSAGPTAHKANRDTIAPQGYIYPQTARTAHSAGRTGAGGGQNLYYLPIPRTSANAAQIFAKFKRREHIGGRDAAPIRPTLATTCRPAPHALYCYFHMEQPARRHIANNDTP